MCTVFIFFVIVMLFGMSLQKLVTFAKENPTQAMEWLNGIRKLFGKQS